MELKYNHGKILYYFVLGIFIWFFASSLSIAYQKSLQHDDAMFATIPKNFLNGYGWATSYGEKIPFNPDISTGPTLLIPGAAMMALFGNQSWVPAMTGTITNIILVLLILWQLNQLMQNRASTSLALLLAISLFTVNDFKTFTAYYTCSLLFVLALLFVINPRHARHHRFAVYGALAAIGLYGKPLILLSFLIALPFIIILAKPESEKNSLHLTLKYLLITITAFLITIAPWQIYKSTVMSQYSTEYRSAYQKYSDNFFNNHGTGIAQLRDAPKKIRYLKKNTIKNFRILSNFLHKENNFSVYLLSILVSFALIKTFREKYLALTNVEKSNICSLSSESVFSGLLAIVIVGNFLWYVIFSFAMTPGHAFFLVFFSFFLFFFFLASQIRSEISAVSVSIIALFFFQVRLPPMAEAYQFKAKDHLISNADILKVKEFLEQNPSHFPLASCGYNAAPWRLEYLLPQSQNFVDCFNVIEDSLAIDASGKKQWEEEPDLTLVIDALTFMGIVKAYPYILEPIAEVCSQHVQFQQGVFIVCDLSFNEYKNKLEPNATAQELIKAQHWYQTRIKSD